MRSKFTVHFMVLVLVLGMGFLGCKREDKDGGSRDARPNVPGVDFENKKIRIGSITDLSGPIAIIGRSLDDGMQLVAKHIASGETDWLPEGWTIEFVVRDHAYNPQRAVELFQEIRDDILYIGMSTANATTIPLFPHLERHKVIAFTAGFSVQMANNRYTPIITASYQAKAMRAVDWMVEEAGGAENVKLGLVYQRDDTGEDARRGVRLAAELHNLEVIERAVARGEADYTSQVTGLRDAGATHVFLGTVAPTVAGILGTAAQYRYAPKWVTWSPGWHESFLNPEVIPSQVFDNYYWATAFPQFKEDHPGLDEFEALWRRYEDGEPGFLTLCGYLTTRIQMELIKRAIETDRLTREGLLDALESYTDLDLGFFGPLDFSSKEPIREVRILRPNFEDGSMIVVSDYTKPLVFQKQAEN